MAGSIASSSNFGGVLKCNTMDKPKSPFILITNAIVALSKTAR